MEKAQLKATSLYAIHTKMLFQLLIITCFISTFIENIVNVIFFSVKSMLFFNRASLSLHLDKALERCSGGQEFNVALNWKTKTTDSALPLSRFLSCFDLRHTVTYTPYVIVV